MNNCENNFHTITERKDAEELLNESENKFRSFVESSSDIIFTLSGEGVFTYVSPTWENLLGHEISEVVGQSFASFVFEEDVELCFEFLKKVLQKRQSYEGVQFRVRKKDESLRWYSANGSVIEKSGNVLGIARDITDSKDAQDSLSYQLQFEKMVSDISTFFVEMPSEQLLQGINHALKQAGKFFQIDRSYVFQFSDDGKKMSNTYEWCAEGIESKIKRLQDFPVDASQWWAEQIGKKKYVYIPDVNSLPPEAEAEKKEFKFQGIRSLLCIPMRIDDILFGFLGLDAVKGKKVWTENHIMLLTIVAELISHAYARYMAEEKVRYLSFHDSLTGLYNRAYLEQEMQRLDTERQLPIGLIMADSNGLKLVNDTYGHKVGDEMLKHTAEVLRNSCRREDIIARWGGDEFVVFLPQATEEDAKAICDRINDRCKEIYVKGIPISLSLGVAIKNNTKKDLTEVLKEAEDNMYKQKRAGKLNV